jgi:hypothetical protein
VVAAVVCPHPPLLLPELLPGAAGALDGLRAACDAAVADGLRRGAERVVVVGAGAATAKFAAAAPGAAAGFGAVPAGDTHRLASAGKLALPSTQSGVSAPDEAWAAGEPLPFRAALPRPTPPTLPLSLAVGRMLLQRGGWTGPVEFWSVASDATPAECVSLGERLSDGPSALFLVLGDGSGVGRNAPPGAAVPAAEPFDDVVWTALGTVDTAALLGVDPHEAVELKAAGRAAWQVLVGAVEADGGTWSARPRHRESPYGVGYFVVSWIRS